MLLDKVKPSSAKAKGRLLQDWTRNQLITELQIHPEDIKTAVMGESGEDIKMARAAREKFPMSIECKNVEKLNVWEANSEPESLAKQAARLACTDLLVSVHGAQATNMIFMPPTSGMIYAARCGCTQGGIGCAAPPGLRKAPEGGSREAKTLTREQCRG